MSHKLKLMVFIFSWAIAISTGQNAHASLLTDVDGLNIGLFEEGGTENLFGDVGSGDFDPNSLTMGYIPDVTWPSTVPAGMPNSSSLMEVTFFETSIFIRQFLTSTGSEGGDGTITNDWLMIIEDIEWPDGSTIVDANITGSTFLSAFTVDFTGSSVNVLYSGGELIGIGQERQATLNLVVERDTVPTPTQGTWLILTLGVMTILLSKRVRRGD